MSHARFAVDPRLASLLGESYRSSEDAVKELVDNAWDADATTVNITLPEPMTNDPILVEDTGYGMTQQEVQQEYLRVARDRRAKRGTHTPNGRLVKGRRGIGKFAGLMVAGEMAVVTRAAGQRTTLVIRNEDLLRDDSRDLERIDLPRETITCDKADHGTTVTLSHLHQNLTFPSSEKLKEILVMEYGREHRFDVFVNGQQVGIRDAPGEMFERKQDVGLSQPVDLTFKIMNQRQTERRSGIALRVDGKIVGKPGFFGLEDDETIPKDILRRIFGEISANGLEVTADWGAVIENSKQSVAIEEWARAEIRAAIEKTFKRELNLQKARLTRAIELRLAAMPEHRREFARRTVERFIRRHYDLADELLQKIVSVLFDALEQDDYAAVIEKIHDAGKVGVAALSEALEEFGMLELSVVAQQCRRRLDFLDSLDKLVADSNTSESQVHKALAANLWVFGSEFALISSNRTLETIVKNYLDKKFAGKRADNRPDLLLTAELDRRYVLIEFKNPRYKIGREDVSQGERYRDELTGQIAPIEIVLVGKDHDTRIDLNPSPRLRLISYPGLISRARAELQWLKGELARPTL
ncbi:MAG TPA: ATP-binding protein [Bryobacteraceae bacterium]|jgi:hypothetical protein|nr:ATP-binding protein [Bryobacteraceae bacterium]